MMNLMRMFSYDKYKGTKNYLKTQKKYEILRTVIFFTLSLSLFLIGYITTKTRLNLLTVIAVLGCLPACNSAVKMIVFLRYKSADEKDCIEIEKHKRDLYCLYDLVFTSYEKNYQIDHLCICGNTICGYSSDTAFPQQDFNKHLTGIFKLDHFKDVSIKIFTQLNKYTERMDQLVNLDSETEKNEALASTIKNVTL